MENIDHWQICDEFTVVQAALLIAGHNPSEHLDFIENASAVNRPAGYDANKNALTLAIINQRLKARVKYKAYEELGYVNYEDIPENTSSEKDKKGTTIRYYTTPDWHLTSILRSDLENWLIQRGKGENSFFFPKKSVEVLPYLDPANLNYSFKLAAAISVWKTLNLNPTLIKGKSVKQAAINLLQEHANDFGLIKENDELNSQAVQEIAKIVNWDTEGGAPKTPGA